MAELLFPNVGKTPEYYEDLYPPRDLPGGTRVTRVAPSPTGYLHLGVLYTALCNRIAAKNGIFYVRIEDTDKKREVEGGTADIVGGLARFGIKADEGFTEENRQTGRYGPYRQSERAEIYRTFAKSLVSRGLAYPCFCAEDGLSEIRKKQEAENVRTGYYGKWARCRDITADEAEAKLKAGIPFVVRLKSPGSEQNRVFFDDCVKGRVEAPENDEDFVLLKSDGIPTYHFAHVIDDHLMRTTHVIRGDEWIPSTPKHLQLFKLLGWRPPKYAHAAPILKSENGGKRKISKRRDPEAAARYFIERGYEPESVIEYLMTVLSSEYEPWRRQNPDLAYCEFPFSFKKMSVSGALFDGDKLNDVAKNTVCRFTPEETVGRLCAWAEKYDPGFYGVLTRDIGYTKAVFSIDRGGSKPRKDIAKWSDAKNYVSYFYRELHTPSYDLPENITAGTAADVIGEYLKVYVPVEDKNEWFSQVKAICPALGFAAETKAYRANPENYRGSAGDAGTVIRVAVTGRVNTPDLCAIMRLLGERECRERLENALVYYEKAAEREE